MANIEIEGSLPHIIVKKLDQLTIKAVIPESWTSNRIFTFEGIVEGTMNKEDIVDDVVTVKEGSIFKATCSDISIDKDWPLYISTVSLIMSKKDSIPNYSSFSYGYNYRRSGPYASNRYKDDSIDDVLILHDREFKKLETVICNGNLAYSSIDGSMQDIKHCRFNKKFTSKAGIVADIMELEGEFMVKPTTGYAKRNNHFSYPLNGDWEASLYGKIYAMVNSGAFLHAKIVKIDSDLDYIKKEFVVPSLIKISVKGELSR